MADMIVGKRSRKSGLPPGALIHIGEKRTERARITIIDYDGERYEEKETLSVAECVPFKDRPTVTWLNVTGIHQVDIVGKLGECFNIHPLITEDILNTEQRPKMEDMEDYVFLVLKMIYYDEKKEALHIEQVSLVLGENFVISFQESEDDVFDQVRERIKANKGRIRKLGADYLAYALADAVVDNYFGVLEKLGEDIEELEEALLAGGPETLEDLHGLKRNMIFLRKSVWPLREIVGRLERGGSPLIKESTGIYLRDVYDHTIQVIDAIETDRDMLSGMLDIYLSSISNRMNEIMKVLTIIATIFIPITFVTGLYGMNFQHMPELGWRWGYPAVWGVILAVSGAMLFYFRRKKWI